MEETLAMLEAFGYVQIVLLLVIVVLQVFVFAKVRKLRVFGKE